MKMQRQHIASGTVWEQQVGYSRAVRVGPFVFVTGTIAADERGNLVEGGAYEQTVAALRKIERALIEAGSSFRDIVRTRLFVTDISQWEEIARAHRELLGDVRPATTMVEVGKLFADALIEIEVDAVRTDG